MTAAATPTTEAIEIALLLEAIHRRYGYDFRAYARPTLERRIRRKLAQSNLDTVSQLQGRVLHDQAFFEDLLLDLSINVTEMFRDPSLFRALRERVLPRLTDRPVIRVWHAGCATGEEAYSMSILLAEAGLTARSRIYATDFNEPVLAQAKDGIYPIGRMRDYTANYQRAGGTRSFADYYTAHYGSAILDPALRTNMVFADHNLATGDVFGEMDVILCRNVLIYFTRELQDRVLGLFRDSLSAGGFLCLGSKESLSFSSCAGDFEAVVPDLRIYRKSVRQDREVSDIDDA